MERLKIKRCPYNIILSNQIFTFKKELKPNLCEDKEPVDMSFFYLRYNTNGEVYIHLNILLEILELKCFNKIFRGVIQGNIISDEEDIDSVDEEVIPDGFSRVKNIIHTRKHTEANNPYMGIIIEYFTQFHPTSLIDVSYIYDYLEQKYFINSDELITFLKINEKYIYDSKRIFDLFKIIAPEKMTFGGKDELIEVLKNFENTTTNFSIFEILKIFRVLERPGEPWIKSFLKGLLFTDKMEIFTLFIDYGENLANLGLLGVVNKVCKLIHSKCTFNEELLKIPILRLSLECKVKDTFNDPLYQLTLKQLKRTHKVKRVNYMNDEKYILKLNRFIKTLTEDDFKVKKFEPLKAISKTSFEDAKRDEKFMEYYTRVYSENLLYLEISSREILGFSDVYANIKSHST